MNLNSKALMFAMAIMATASVGCRTSTDEQSEHSEATAKASNQELQRAEADVSAHADELYAAIKLSRSELREMRIAAGLHAHAAGPHIDPEGHHANDSPEQQARERNEREGHEDGEGHESGGDRGHREGSEREHSERSRGEHNEGGERGHREGGEREHSEDGESGHKEGGERHASGGRISKLTKHVMTYKNGAELTLQYNPTTQAFVGSVTNTTSKALEDVRVEIHLSNGTELGPTRRTTVAPDQTIPVELGAFGEDFTHWTTHPEAGNEEAHSEGDEARERSGGEHGGERSGHAERERGEHSRERGGHAERERGEHGREGNAAHSHDGAGEGGHGVGNASLRPVYNQILLLRGEMAAFAADLENKGNEE